jgi:hypothetical protein
MVTCLTLHSLSYPGSVSRILNIDLSCRRNLIADSLNETLGLFRQQGHTMTILGFVLSDRLFAVLAFALVWLFVNVS